MQTSRVFDFKLFFLFCWTFSFLPASSYAAPPAPLNLNTDAHLQRPVTLDRTGISLEDLLHSLSSSDVTLTCDQECAQQKLQLRIKGRPLRELMTALAEMLPGSWKAHPDRTGYVLQMDSNAVYQRRHWWDIFLAARKEAVQPVIQALLAAMRMPPPPNQNTNTTQDDSSLPPFPTAVDRQEFFSNLPADLQQAIAERLDEMASFSGEGLVSDDDEGALLMKISDLPAKSQDVLHHLNRNLPEGAFVRFTNDGSQIQANFIDSQGKYVVSTLAVDDRTSALKEVIGLNLSNLARLTQSDERRKASLALRQLAEYQAKTFWKNALPQQSGQHRFPPPRRADLLRDIAGSDNIEFVADYYSQPGVPLPPKAQPQPLDRPLEDDLNQIADEYDP